MGRKLKIRVVDNASSDWGLITCDSFVTCYHSIEGVPQNAKFAKDVLPSGKVLGENDPYQVLNGDFETGDLTGWLLLRGTYSLGDIGYVSMQEVYWKDLTKQYGMGGTYLFTGIEDVSGSFESYIGVLESSSFTVGGCGFITFKLGGGKNPDCYVEIIDASTEETLARYHNDEMNEGKLIQYKADLTAFMGRNVKIRVVDYAQEEWGCLAVDDFITHYETVEELPLAILIKNYL
ncbi:MAG: hypothetical protein IJ800_00355 [Clostridia bacterium]|nr:hypothetical protein [Clostridia bacterium]